MSYKVNDRCRITQNLLSPSSIGDVITITEVHVSIENRPFYTIRFDDGMVGYASENCLKLVET
jgi:hypothetical protein